MAAGVDVLATAEPTIVAREKPQFVELRFETDFLTWADYDLLEGYVVRGEPTKRKELMALIKKCHIGKVAVETMPFKQIEVAAIELYLAINAASNPGDGEGNLNGG